MDIHVVIQIATAIIASVGASGLIVVGLSSWLGKVWAARLMQKDVAKYATELEALKSKFEQSHRRLQSELDKTVFGHQLTTQNEFNGLSEIWKTIPPLERSMKY